MITLSPTRPSNGQAFYIGAHRLRTGQLSSLAHRKKTDKTQYRQWLWSTILTQDFEILEEVYAIAAAARQQDVTLWGGVKNQAEVIRDCLEWMIQNPQHPKLPIMHLRVWTDRSYNFQTYCMKSPIPARSLNKGLYTLNFQSVTCPTCQKWLENTGTSSILH